MRTFHILLFVFIASFVISGAVDAIFRGFENENEIIHAFFITFMIGLLCATHIRDHKVSAPIGVAVFCALISPIGVPYYAFKYFGFRVGGVKVLIALAILVLSFLLYFGVFFALDYFTCQRGGACGHPFL